jgi:hypothetical protein|nr:MAG TPA: ASCH domain protein [Caudoviricetes sp.]
MKKIMFADRFALTQAVLNGMKTQTRRIVPQKEIDNYEDWLDEVTSISTTGCGAVRYETLIERLLNRTPYRIGEIVAVAQNYTDAGVGVQKLAKLSAQEHPVTQRSNFLKKVSGWKNKMFVRADLMPHQIRITNLRVQRLQGITDEECAKEGIRVDETTSSFWDERLKDTRFYPSPREAYADLIDRISGRGTWESTPYVFVYDFELVK